MEIAPISEPWAGTAQISYLTYGISSSSADKAKTTGGINDLYPYLSAFSLVSLAVGIFIAAGCTKPVAVKIAKTIIHAPVIHVGI